MKLALCLDGLPAGDLPGIAAEAERRRFRKALAAKTTGAEPFVACAPIAAATRSILVGTGIAGLHGRSAASIAMAAVSLVTLSGYRFLLGLGLRSKRLVKGLHGTDLRRASGHAGDDPRRPGAARGRLVTFDGQAVGIEGRRRAFPPRPPVPIHRGALGPRMLELCGEAADGLLGWFCSRPFLTGS